MPCVNCDKNKSNNNKYYTNCDKMDKVPTLK